MMTYGVFLLASTLVIVAQVAAKADPSFQKVIADVSSLTPRINSIDADVKKINVLSGLTKGPETIAEGLKSLNNDIYGLRIDNKGTPRQYGDAYEEQLTNAFNPPVAAMLHLMDDLISKRKYLKQLKAGKDIGLQLSLLKYNWKELLVFLESLLTDKDQKAVIAEAGGQVTAEIQTAYDGFKKKDQQERRTAMRFERH